MQGALASLAFHVGIGVPLAQRQEELFLITRLLLGGNQRRLSKQVTLSRPFWGSKKAGFSRTTRTKKVGWVNR